MLVLVRLGVFLFVLLFLLVVQNQLLNERGGGVERREN